MFCAEHRPLDWFRDRKVTVMGLGLFGGGRGVTEFLAKLGARVTVTDLRSEEKLRPTLAALDALTFPHHPLRFVLERHDEADFLAADLVIASPAVPRDSLFLSLCRQRGVPLETELNLFFKLCPGRIVAVTGSNGKTTTTHLVAAMARRAWPRTLMGGNVGCSLLPQLSEVCAGDWVVIEISSFQLDDLRALERRPEVSLVTNLSPNHLDRHGTYESYLAAKRVAIEPGPEPNVAVLNGDDAELARWAAQTSRHVCLFTSAPPEHGRCGIHIDFATGEVVDARTGHPRWLFSRADLRLRGRHNVCNAAAAAGAALAMGVAGGEIRAALREFRGVEHRLELVAEVDGVEFYNDSIATTPESVIAALEAFAEGSAAGERGSRTILIAGGAEKGCSFDELGRAVCRLAGAIVLLGHTADAIETAVRRGGSPPTVVRVGDVEEAVGAARHLARHGDRVVLSPACPSYDQFLNFEERGRRFKDVVRTLT